MKNQPSQQILDTIEKLTRRALALPKGSWPETAQAWSDLDDALPRGWTRKTAMAMVKTLDANPGPGRPAKDGVPADAQIQIRTTLARKSAYVRAAQPLGLSEWVLAQCDQASGYKPK